MKLSRADSAILAIAAIGASAWWWLARPSDSEVSARMECEALDRFSAGVDSKRCLRDEAYRRGLSAARSERAAEIMSAAVADLRSKLARRPPSGSFSRIERATDLPLDPIGLDASKEARERIGSRYVVRSVFSSIDMNEPPALRRVTLTPVADLGDVLGIRANVDGLTVVETEAISVACGWFVDAETAACVGDAYLELVDVRGFVVPRLVTADIAPVDAKSLAAAYRKSNF